MLHFPLHRVSYLSLVVEVSYRLEPLPFCSCDSLGANLQARKMGIEGGARLSSMKAALFLYHVARGRIEDAVCA